MASLGTDGGGSIRRPASHCGVLGLKPSIGRVPRGNGLPDILNGYEVLGPMARSVADLRLLYGAIAGPDWRDPRSWPFGAAPGGSAPLPGRRRVLHVARVAGQPVDEPVVASFALTRPWLEGIGCSVTAGDLPLDMDLFFRHWPTIGESGLARAVPENRLSEVSPHLLAMARRGMGRTAPDYAAALAAFHELGRQMGRVLDAFDIVATPTAAAGPGPAEENGPPHERAFTSFVNVLGLPAISIPGPTAAGMPAGLQLIGRFGSEEILLDLAQELEAQHPWPRLAPELP
jgi:aspartyl-tRNA(Asn)/glutamyl-tRNA(Gln) amidotransferase subunit A